MASTYLDKITALLREHGARLERTKKHKVWRFPDGRIWVVAGTPHSDYSYQRNYHELRDFLGVRETRRKNPDRATKQGVAHPEKFTELAKDGPRDFVAVLASIKRYVRPAPCPDAMWLERFPCTPLWAILRRAG